MFKRFMGIFMFMGILAAAALPARAVDKGQMGLLFSIDPQPSLGMSFHLSRNFALRIHVGYSSNSAETTNDVETLPWGEAVQTKNKQDGTLLAFGLGGYYYFRPAADFSLYTGLDMSYGWNKIEASANSSYQNFNWTQSTDDWSVKAVLGAQYLIGGRLGIFGEVGFGGNWTKLTAENSIEALAKAHTLGFVNSGIGIVFYF